MTRLSVEMSVDEENSNGSDKPHDADRSREWFGVQLEVINLLLEAERRKLCVLQRELKTALEEGGSIKAKEHQKQELITAIQRIQLQYDNLEKECRQHAIGALKASNTRGTGKVETVASKNSETVSTQLEKDLKLDNLEPGKEKPNRTLQNGSVGEASQKSSEGKPKPPVPPKRSTLTFGQSYVSVGESISIDPSSIFSPTGVQPSEISEETCQPLTSHLVTVTTNILSTTPKGLPTPRIKNQRVLSTFLPALPPKFCKSPLAQSPNFSRTPTSEPEKRTAEPEKVPEIPQQKPERRVSEKDSTSPSSLSSTKTQSSSTSLSLEKDVLKDENGSVKSSAGNTPNKTEPQQEFFPSQSPSSESFSKSPPLPELPVGKPSPKTSPPLLESSPVKKTEDDAKEPDVVAPSETLYLDDSNEKTNTIKRAPSSEAKNEGVRERIGAGGAKLRPKSPVRVSFANDEDSDVKVYEKLSRTKRATKELKNIIHQIEYSESDYCSDDNCRTCVVRKTSSLSRRRSASPKTTFLKSADLLEGYTSCCEEGTKTLPKKTKNLTRKISERKSDATTNRVLCNCPLDNLVIDNRIPISRPNSSIGDYCTQPARSKSGVRAKKNSNFGLKTPFWSGGCGSKIDYERPGLSLIITISSDGIDKQPKRTVQFISGGPAVNFGLGGTLGRYTKTKSQDKSLKISGSSFHTDHSASDFEADWGKYSLRRKGDQEGSRKGQIEEETTQEILTAQTQSDKTSKSIPALERQKSAGELRRPRSSRATEEYKQRYFDSLSRKKSPGEVLEHFGKLATSVTTSEISKLSNCSKTHEGDIESVKGHIKAFEKISKSGQSHENYRTVPPTSFNNPDPYLGSAFVQYVRETLPHQPNSFPVGATGSAFNKYIRPGSGRFDKSLIFPQQPKSDKPSAFERLCGDKIYASRKGIYGKPSGQNQSVSGSLDCVWGKPKPNETPKVNNSEDETPGKDSRPASCTYEIGRGRPLGGAATGPYSNYSLVTPVYGKDRAASGIPRTSKKGIIESETSTTSAQIKASGQQGVKSNPPQYFNPRSLENYKLAPGFKTDLSTLYSGVFYTNPKQDGGASLSDSTRILNEYGIKHFGSLNRSKEETIGESSSMGTSSSTGSRPSVEVGNGRKMLTGGVASLTAANRIPEEAAPGVTVTFPPQYHPTDEELMQETPQSNRSQPAIGLKQTPKSRPTIFGTVASDQIPKDASSRRSLPQTTLGSSNGGSTEFSSSLESVQETTPEKDNALVYRDGNLVSGSMEALVQHMVPTAEYYPDRAYLFAFLLSSRLFIKPHELLGEVCALCDQQQRLGGKDPPSKECLGRFIPHFVQLLGEWTETFPYDFRDERVMVHVRNITQKCVTVDPSIRKEVSTLLQNLLVRLTTLEKYEEFLMRISAENSTDCLEGLNSTDVTELCGTPGLLAQQLTHIELERLSYIGPEEFVQAFAKENPNLGTSFKDMKKTRNLESYVSWFNRLSYLVATDVCKHVKKKQRVRVMEYWIETARECFNIGNFNSLMAIIAGLNMSPVARLKKTWSKIQSGKFSVLEHQMDPSSNFSSYRSTLKAAMWRSAGATDQRQRIVIPFFSLLVKDLYFLNEGCSNKLPNGHINFEKFWQLAKQVTEFITWKQVACPFEKCTKVITFLQASPVLTENALALASFECEPPENNHEKERYKSLK